MLQLNGAVTASSAGALMAISDRLFQREGLSVHLRPGKDDADVASAVAADIVSSALLRRKGF